MKDYLELAYEQYGRGNNGAIIRGTEARAVASTTPLPEPVFDLGCGRGHVAACIWNSTDHHVIANEVQEGHIRWMKENRADVYKEFLYADCTTTGLPDSSVGSVVSISVAEHMPVSFLTLTLRENHRILKSGGKLVITTYNKNWHDFLFLKDFRQWEDWWEQQYHHVTLLNNLQWRGLLLQAGFQNTRFTEIFSRPLIGLFDISSFYRDMWQKTQDDVPQDMVGMEPLFRFYHDNDAALCEKYGGAGYLITAEKV